MDGAGVLGIVNDLTKDTSMPIDVVNAHIGKLQSQVGLLSGKRELSAKKLQEVASNAARPKEFVEKYGAAAAQGTSNLVSMCEILHGVCLDPTAMKYFGAPEPSAAPERNKGSKAAYGGGGDFQALKERLLQQVGSRGMPDAFGGAGLSNGHQRPFSERTHMTLDYLDEEHLVRTQVGKLGQIPVVSQESAIIEDLLYCLIGIEGTHVKPKKVSSSSGSVVFSIDDSLDPSLKELLSRITPLCSAYSSVVRFAEANMVMEAGRVNQALAGALYKLIGDYYVFVTQLETQHRKGELSLNKIWFYVQPTLQTMKMLSETCESITRLGARGGRTLSLLHQQLQSCQSGNASSRTVAEHLATVAAGPYFETLSKWVHRGIIYDPGKDFFVQDNEVIERSELPLEYSDDYWERRYSIRPDQIPSFLHNYSAMILSTGKYLNVIQQCDKSIRWPDGQAPDVVYMASAEQYTEPLEKAHEFASKTLLELLVKDKDLIGHLRSVKHYFLLDQGDFIVQFLDLCEQELSQNVNQVEPARLESLLELAQRTSAANTDPYKDNVCVELLPYDLIFQMSKIQSIDTDVESEYRSFAAAELTGLEAFAFGYEVKWPVSLVLNRRNLACYQMLLRHLFYCKHVERRVCDAWVATKTTRFLSKSSFAHLSESFALRQKMLNFLQNLEYYMTFEVLEPKWEDMIAKIRSSGNAGSSSSSKAVSNVDQVLEIHSDFLTGCLNDCMLSNPGLLRTVKNLLGVCVGFADFLRESARDDRLFAAEVADSEEMANFHQEVIKYDLQFNAKLVTLLDQIAEMGRDNYNERVLNILNRLNFNGFYSKEVDQFTCEGGGKK